MLWFIFIHWVVLFCSDVQRTIVDALSEEVSIKADEKSVNDMRTSLASANDKIEKLDSRLRNIIDNVNNNRKALQNLESSLPKGFILSDSRELLHE